MTMTARAPDRLLLINPNTSEGVTQRLHAALLSQWGEFGRLAAPGQAPVAAPTVTAVTASFGAPYISCEASHAVAAHAVMQAWLEHRGPDPARQAVLIGCFGDPGLFALRERCPAPVTGLAEASFIEAARHGSFAVVTGGARWPAMLRRLAQSLGFGHVLRHIEAVAPTGAQLMADEGLAQEHLLRACRAAQAQGVQAIIIGGAGLTGWAQRLQPLLQVPLIDSVHAGLRVLLQGQAPMPPSASPDLLPLTEMVHPRPGLGRPPGQG